MWYFFTLDLKKKKDRCASFEQSYFSLNWNLKCHHAEADLIQISLNKLILIYFVGSNWTKFHILFLWSQGLFCLNKTKQKYIKYCCWVVRSGRVIGRATGNEEVFLNLHKALALINLNDFLVPCERSVFDKQGPIKWREWDFLCQVSNHNNSTRSSRSFPNRADIFTHHRQDWCFQAVFLQSFLSFLVRGEADKESAVPIAYTKTFSVFCPSG